MKLRYFAPVLALFLAGCFGSLTTMDVPPVRGAVEVEVALAPGLLLPNRLDHLVTIEIQAHHPNDELDNSQTVNYQGVNVSKTFSSVPPVKALVTARATKAGTKVAEATASVMVVSSATASVTIPLSAPN
jgi:hypothetical protein